MNPILAIVGPTGIGKTKLAIHLAQKFQAELISADSRQVYIGMDVGTGKDAHLGQWTTINQRRTLVIDTIPLHGLDVITPDQEFSIANWQTLVYQLINEIYQRSHQPIIVGGTSFYLDALQGKVQTLNIKPNLPLRQDLANLSAQQLLARLSQINPDRANQLNSSDQHNPARLIRAIEIANSQTASNPQASEISHPPTSLKLLGLTMPKNILLSQTDARVDAMIKQGLIPEVKTLMKHHGPTSQAMTGIGYYEIAAYLNHQLSQDQAIQRIKIRTHQYTKRQYTWLKKQPVNWIDISQTGWQEQAEDMAITTLTQQ